MSDRIKYGESIGMGSTPTSPQPTHVAPSTGAISERPEWASGPDWEGWRVCDVPIIGAYTGYMARNFKSGGGARIYRRRHEPSGGLWVRDIDGEVATLRCISPAHALTAANALAEAAGGWA